MRLLKFATPFFIVVIVFILFPVKGFAQNINETLEGIILSAGEPQYKNGLVSQDIELKITKGVLKNDTINIKNEMVETAEPTVYKSGNRVFINYTYTPESGKHFQITDFVRYRQLFFLFVLFVLVTLIGAGVYGLRSILGLVYSFAILIFGILPAISAGFNPLLVAILGAMIIAPVTFYSSHGINRKTTVALCGTFVALIITALLSSVFIDYTYLQGFGSDEASFLSVINSNINIQGLFLAGIIIGTLGILDDATVSQSSIVYQLKKANPDLKGLKLYKMAMSVGHDHIASAVNTLVLVYAGASLPLLLLFTSDNLSFTQGLNFEIVAEEVLRTLVASIGLILSVPITTALAVRLAKSDEPEDHHEHTH